MLLLFFIKYLSLFKRTIALFAIDGAVTIFVALHVPKVFQKLWKICHFIYDCIVQKPKKEFKPQSRTFHKVETQSSPTSNRRFKRDLKLRLSEILNNNRGHFLIAQLCVNIYYSAFTHKLRG